MSFISMNLINGYQSSMYELLNNFSEENGVTGRLLSVPVALADAFLDFVIYPLTAIERVVKAAFKLIDAAFKQDINELKWALQHSEQALAHAVSTPVALALSPLKFAFQTLVIAIDPAKARPFYQKNCHCSSLS